MHGFAAGAGAGAGRPAGRHAYTPHTQRCREHRDSEHCMVGSCSPQEKLTHHRLDSESPSQDSQHYCCSVVVDWLVIKFWGDSTQRNALHCKDRVWFGCISAKSRPEMVQASTVQTASRGGAGHQARTRVCTAYVHACTPCAAAERLLACLYLCRLSLQLFYIYAY
jgi:hypothetical protein